MLNLSNRHNIYMYMYNNLTTRKLTQVNDMFEIILDNTSTDIITNIDPETNIIFVTNTEDRILSASKDGAINIKNLLDINLSGTKLLNNHLSVIELISKFKMILPRGIKPSFKPPFDNTFINNIYTKYNYYGNNKENENLSNYYLYDNFKFTLYIDMEQIKNYTGTLLIKRFTDLISLYLLPYYHVGNHGFTAINKIYWISNSEIYKKCGDIFNV